MCNCGKFDNLPDNLPDWASSGNWLGPEGHADLKNHVDDPSLYNLCSFPLKLFKDEAEIISSLDLPCDLPCATSLAGIQPVRPRAQRTSP